MYKKDLGIVICNFNKIDYLRDCLKSISEANFDNLTYDIIVVDNASNDGSEEMIIEEFPNVILIQTGSNLGGAGGFARGMQYVLDNKYKYLSVLDNDTKVDPNAFMELKNYLDKNNEVGVVGATILKMDEPEIIQEMGAQLNYNLYGFTLNYNDRLYDSSIPEIVDCDYVPACCFMTRYEDLKEIGTFDEKFFIYWDDIDWCTRVKKSGKKIHAISESKVWHKGGAKLATNTFPSYYFGRNLIKFFLRNISFKEVDKMANEMADAFSKVFYFSAKKKEYSQLISIVMGMFDAYADNYGPKWDSILERTRAENELYKKLNGLKVAILDCEDILYMRNIIKNSISAGAYVTLFCNKLDIEEIKKYFPQIIVLEKSKYTENNFDKTIQAVSHISKYREYEQNDSFWYLDPYSNYIISVDDKLNVERYDEFREMFFNVFYPVFKIKFEKIKKDLLIN